MIAEEELHLQGIAHADKAPYAPSALRFRATDKRSFDIVVATVLLVLTLPVMGLVAVAIWLGDRGPILYRHRRVGFANREFGMCKFRSMVPGADKMSAHLCDVNIVDGLLFKVADDPRFTRIGRGRLRFCLYQ